MLVNTEHGEAEEEEEEGNPQKTCVLTLLKRVFLRVTFFFFFFCFSMFSVVQHSAQGKDPNNLKICISNS